MILACYGGGTNSTALIIEWIKLGRKIDVILFADTGGERPQTYDYIDMFSDWVYDRIGVKITTLKTANETLEENCLRRKSLPSLAYGFKTCSQRFKMDQQNKFMNNLPEAKEAWANGEKITKLVGFDADEPWRAKDYDDKKYELYFPLIMWNYGRDECIGIIEDAGLPQPGKSSCFFCPSMTHSEIRSLNATNPDLIERALAMEANADLTVVAGLGRSISWKNILSNEDMFGDESYRNLIPIDCGCYDG
jgi:hypothetical protein